MAVSGISTRLSPTSRCGNASFQNLLQARREWETIFSAIGNPALILDPSRTILEANDAVLRLTGKTLDELRSMKCWQVFHGDRVFRSAGWLPV